MTVSTDFFTDLERQLVAATQERPRRRRRARIRRAAAGAGAAALLVAGGVTAVALVSGDTTERPVAAPRIATATATTPATAAPPTAAIDPAGVRVAILNGTAIPGLARTVATQLQDGGFTAIGTVTNAARQDVTRTRVLFRKGHQREAALVAAGLPGYDGSLWQIQAGVADALAAAAVAGDGAEVIVVVGADRDPRTP